MRFEFFQHVKFSYFCGMNLRHKLFLLAMSFVVLVTNIGLNVYTHWCEEDGAFISYVIPANDHCGEEEEVAVLPPCCQQESQSCVVSVPQIDKEDCCSDEFDWIKLSVDQDQSSVEKSKLKWVEQKFQILPLKETPRSILASNHLVKRTIDPPPCLKGREIVIKNQVFRI